MESMAQQMLQVVGGVDTHKQFHVAAAVDQIGRILGTARFPADRDGYQRLLAWLEGFGSLARVGVEGTGSWGAGLGRFLIRRGVAVVEVDRPNRQRRRRRGKSDPTDAESAARTVLAGDATGAPKAQTGRVEAIRFLRLTRKSAMKAKTQAGNQLHSVLDTAPEAIRACYRGLSMAVTVRRVLEAAVVTSIDDPVSGASYALGVLARRWRALQQEIAALDKQLDGLVAKAAPKKLLDKKGVGTQVAAVLLVAAGDNPERLTSDASYAAVCGTSPVEASSGKTSRHRLNRGGNRDANNALWRIVMTRLAHDPVTRAYMERRTAEGKSKKEVIRCLKRYVAREVYRALRPAPAQGT